LRLHGDVYAPNAQDGDHQRNLFQYGEVFYCYAETRMLVYILIQVFIRE